MIMKPGDTQMPNFDTWAKHVELEYLKYDPYRNEEVGPTPIKEALKAAFEQGYYLYKRIADES